MAWNPATNTWSYSAYWEQSTASARLTMARKFITELNDAITARVQGNGEAFDPGTLVNLLESVKRDLPRLEKEANSEGGVGLPRAISTVTKDMRSY